MNGTVRRLDPAVRAGVVKRGLQVVLVLVFQAAVLFLAAGGMHWVWAWIFLGLNFLGIVCNSFFMLGSHAETMAERANAQGMKDWDKVIGGLWSLMQFVGLLLAAGLDARWGWTGPLSFGAHLAGAIVFIIGFALFSWAMIANAYFTAAVRLQNERGQTVCEAGPYKAVRHPGYVGAILQSLGAPLLLGSYWALLPGAAAAILMVVRTAFEDRMLRGELAGYADYARRVKYRLLPGIW